MKHRKPTPVRVRLAPRTPGRHRPEAIAAECEADLYAQLDEFFTWLEEHYEPEVAR